MSVLHPFVSSPSTACKGRRSGQAKVEKRPALCQTFLDTLETNGCWLRRATITPPPARNSTPPATRPAGHRRSGRPATGAGRRSA
ncbi:hypothetical protein D0Z70_02405 [Sphingobium terrigena]|uniref:Uncharacterized protein n=1 Tax=Sphingobium terrigena TaxID=2304063 RepID=A0A418YWW1_9SPHN|nr:hypothetical protein D0Z70_02405 [Sphingobium terrigena]